MGFINKKNIQFEHILHSIQDWLGRFGDNTASNPSSVVGQIIQAVSAVGHNLIAYVEDALTEQNKHTATRRKSIYGLASLTGYQPSTGTAARCMVRLYNKPHNKTTTSVYLSNGTAVVSSSGVMYTLELDSTATAVSTGDMVADQLFHLIQGKYETQRFASSGQAFFTTNIRHLGFLDQDTIEVKVNGELWKKVASLYDLAQGERGYYVRTSITDGVDVVFGNGFHGAIPPEGQSVEVKYLLHDGESGNITDPQETFLFRNLLMDDNGDEVDGNLLFEMRLASGSSVTGGTDAELESQVREMIGYNSRSLVLVSPENFDLFLSRFSFVGYNRTWSDPGSLVIRSLIMRSFKGKPYFDLTEKDLLLTEMQKDLIQGLIYNGGKLLAGATYQIEEPEIWKYCAYIYLKGKGSVDRDGVNKKIRVTLANFFSNITDDRYVPKSDITKAIQEACPEVDGVSVYFLSEKNEEAIRNGEYEDSELLWHERTGTYRVARHTVKVYAGENPLRGLDEHGNIFLSSPTSFPVLIGGWRWRNKSGQEITTQPINIVWE